MIKEELIDLNEYDIYEDGRIYSKGYNKNKYLKGNINKYGYVRVALKCIDGKQRHFQWHRVIWTYFNGAIPEGMQVNHIDENKQNNALSNLNLMTCKENINYGTHNKRVAAKQKGVPKPYMIERNKRLCNKPVVAVDEEGNVVLEFASTAEAGRNGFNHRHVSECCRGCYIREGNNIYKNFRWYFKKDWLKIKGVA